MGDRCYSTVICSVKDQATFEALGYRCEAAEAVTFEGENIPNVLVMVAPEASQGNYDELTGLKGVPFLVSNAASPGAFGDHLMASDGKEWSYAEALWESNYPAVRVKPEGEILSEDLKSATDYWRIYYAALEAFKEHATQPLA